MNWSLRGTRILQDLAKLVIRHHEPVEQRDFRFIAVMLLALTVATACAAGYAYVATAGQACVTSESCDVWMAPSAGGPPFKAPSSRRG